ncbi:MAG TPA: SWIM zinc finger family protein [Blastocatellia bacterium]|nr:SWIM zinc finger family protein [Blastocatellia bacterium]
MNWTAEQILALAPDAASAKAGQGLATARKWQTLGADERTAWGLCQGSGKDPYQTQIDLTEPAFRCSCPSRKFPCKHALGLFLLLAAQPAAFKEKKPPDWVGEWVASRAKRSQQRVEKQVKAEAGEKTVDVAAQAKRAANREAKVTTGLQELELWLRDIARGGLAAVQSQPLIFWERTASRLVDAQAPGVARLVREMAGVTASGEGWEGRLLERLSRLYLLIEGFKRGAELPEAVRTDIRSLIGWTQNQEDLLRLDGASDRWLVLGQRVEEEDRLRVQRIWLWGEQSGRAALILHFAHAQQPLDASFVTGAVIEAELVFFPGAYPLRAIVKHRHGAPTTPDRISGYAKIIDAHEAFLGAMAANPWLEKFPMPLLDVTPLCRGDVWLVCDAEGRALRLAPRFEFGWTMLSLSGGHGIDVFGEWDGDHLWPLSAFAENRFVKFG